MTARLVTVLLMVLDRSSKKELHSEVVGIPFEHEDKCFIKGMDYMKPHHHESIGYWTRNGSVSLIIHPTTSRPEIFRTNNQKEKLLDLCAKITKVKGWCTDSVILDVVECTEKELKEKLDALRKDPKNILWQGELK